MQPAHPMPAAISHHDIPARAGVGLKARHYRTILESRPDIGFFEVHAENYMGPGGPPHRYLTEIRSHYPLCLHGVGLSIGAEASLDPQHLRRLAELLCRYEPGLFSEHLAWSSHEGRFFNDLLPVPYTQATLHRVCEHIDQIQQRLARQMLLENPSTYLTFEENTYEEVEFLGEVARRTGCALLLDVNNLLIACTNQQWDPLRYLERFPMTHVRQIHLAGHGRDTDSRGRTVLIDSHDRPVDLAVWELYSRAIARLGPMPTLIEWDQNLPEWPDLLAEAARAEARLLAPTQRIACRHATVA